MLLCHLIFALQQCVQRTVLTEEQKTKTDPSLMNFGELCCSAVFDPIWREKVIFKLFYLWSNSMKMCTSFLVPWMKAAGKAAGNMDSRWNFQHKGYWEGTQPTPTTQWSSGRRQTPTLGYGTRYFLPVVMVADQGSARGHPTFRSLKSSRACSLYLAVQRTASFWFSHQYLGSAKMNDPETKCCASCLLCLLLNLIEPPTYLQIWGSWGDQSISGNILNIYLISLFFFCFQLKTGALLSSLHTKP